MTKAHQDAMIKFKQLGQQLEEYEKSEKKVKRLRNFSIFAFILSIVLIVASQMVISSVVITGEQLYNIIKSLPGKEYAFLVLGIVSFAFLIVSVFRSINVEMKAEKARRIEGLMAQKLFRLMLVHAKRN